MKILIADDDPVCRLLLQSLLVSAGHEVLVAADGHQAWNVLDLADGPLVAILDWYMPGPDGPELCQRIRQLPPHRLVYAMLLTGRSGRDSVVFGLEAGAHDYLTKPFDQAELFARLHVGMRMLRLQQALGDRVRELEEALGRVRQLQGLLPMCCYCKSIRADKDYWQQVEHYFAEHSDVKVSHGICPSCYTKVVEPQIAAYRRTPAESRH